MDADWSWAARKFAVLTLLDRRRSGQPPLTHRLCSNYAELTAPHGFAVIDKETMDGAHAHFPPGWRCRPSRHWTGRPHVRQWEHVALGPTSASGSHPMLLNLLTGIPMMLLCLIMEAIFVTLCLRYHVHHYLRFQRIEQGRKSLAVEILLLGVVMLLMLLGNFVQIILWAALFVWLGEFREFATALYYSAVNFSTLGYGDIVMSARWRLLGPLEAATGILMFGVTTAVMTAAVTEVIKHSAPRLRQGDEP